MARSPKKKKKGNKKYVSKWGEMFKRSIGRPKKYETIDEVWKIITTYLEECTWDLPTKEGICVELGISRETYNRWKVEKHQFSDTIKKAEDIIRTAWVEHLRVQASTGAIFYLKNAFKEDFRDRYEHGGDPNQPLVLQIVGAVAQRFDIKPDGNKPDAKTNGRDSKPSAL